MANSVELARLIKFALHDLSGENGHFTFEHVCRHFAKHRIVSNVLPATGPVGSGGDQGRDFETFRTYLLEELPFATGFLALASNDVIAFACTIQREGLRSKFERDITAICSSGCAVDRVVIFAAADVPVRLRHDLEEWSSSQYQIELEIIDGNAMAELIADSSLFWIAHQYLNLPAEVAPDAEQPDTALPDSYVELRNYWQKPAHHPLNLGDMLEIRRGMRYALPPGPARADLDGWLTLMDHVIADSPDEDLTMRAVYESVIARSRGKADLRPIEPQIRQYVTDALSIRDPSILWDASLVIQATSTAAAMGHTDIPLSESLSWLTPLRQHIADLLHADLGPNLRAGLLQAAAHLGMHFDWSDADACETQNLALEHIDQEFLALKVAIDCGTVEVHIGSARLVDVDYAMERLSELVDLLPDAPAYPIDAFASFFDLMAPSLRDHDLYRRVCDGFDAAIRQQAGEAAVAERCHHRAMALDEAGRPLDALRELHEAKANWFHGDTFHASLTAVAAIAAIYSQLGMNMAAKRYALGLASLALKSADPHDHTLVPIALFSAANSDHYSGAWIASADLASIAGLAHFAYAPNPADLDTHEYVLRAAGMQVLTLIAAEQLRPNFLPTLSAAFAGGPLEHLIETGVAETRPDHLLGTEDDCLQLLTNDAGEPFSDVGPERSIAFNALGVGWVIRGLNDEPTNLAMEDFASTLQILLVEVAIDDAVIVPGEVEIEIRTHLASQPPDHATLTRAEGGKRLWRVTMPADPAEIDLEEFRKNIYAWAFQVLLGNSLLDDDSADVFLERTATKALFSKFEIGHRSYHQLAKFRPESPRPLTAAENRRISGEVRRPLGDPSEHLAAKRDQGPTYTKAKARSILEERYLLLPKPIRHTFPDLLKTDRVLRIFQELKAQDGWKDWHLMNVVVSLTVNHRITARHGELTDHRLETFGDELRRESMREELVDDLRISASAITRESMVQCITAVAMSTLWRWGLDLPYEPPDPTAIVQVLADRYGFWDDDVPHHSPFSPFSAAGLTPNGR